VLKCLLSYLQTVFFVVENPHLVFLSVFTDRNAEIITKVIKVTRLQENPGTRTEQGRCHRHSLKLQLGEVRARRCWAEKWNILCSVEAARVEVGPNICLDSLQ